MRVLAQFVGVDPRSKTTYIGVMSLFRRFIGLFVAAILALLFALPLDVFKDLYVGPIADEARHVTGLSMPKLETILSYASFSLPLLAAISTLYLYHIFYVNPLLRKIKAEYQPIRESEQRNPIDLKAIAAVLFLVCFVPAVLYAGYVDRFRAPILSPAKYTEFHHLPNLELRERALNISNKLNELDRKYLSRQGELKNQYDKDSAEFSRATIEFDKKKEEYDRAVQACPLGGIPFHFPSSSITPGSSSITAGSTAVVPLPCTPPAMPSPPSAPKFPVVSVDAQWKVEIDKVQEEAAAIWEELRHREGGYTLFFTVPSNYNLGTSRISVASKSLEDAANRLH
jgi:hypothetical protein